MGTQWLRQRERGSAMVEFCVLMLVFVPLIFYGFFFSDLGHHLLDLQETVISATWDFAGRTQQKGDLTGGDSTAIQALNRIEFVDHTSAFDDYNDIGTDASGGKDNGTKDSNNYHYEFASKAAWVGQGGEEVTCSVDTGGDDLKAFTGGINLGGLGGAVVPVMSFGTNPAVTQGGVAKCFARLRILNEIIPQKFMQDHAHVDLSKTTMTPGNPEGTGDATQVVLSDQAVMLYGTWALDDGSTSGLPKTGTLSDTHGDIDYGNNSSNPFYKRVVIANTAGGLALTYGNAVLPMFQLMGKAISKVEIIPVIPVIDIAGIDTSSIGGLLDSSPIPIGNPAGVELVSRYKRDAAASGGYERDDFESTPFKKFQNSKYQTVYQSRGPYYLGASTDKG